MTCLHWRSSQGFLCTKQISGENLERLESKLIGKFIDGIYLDSPWNLVHFHIFLTPTRDRLADPLDVFNQSVIYLSTVC